MKMKLLYTLAVIGVISLLLILKSVMFTHVGSTLFVASDDMLQRNAMMAGSVSEFGSANKSMSAPVDMTDGSSALVARSPHSPAEDGQTQAVMKRMIIRNANLTLQTENISQAIDKISHIAEKSGGYVVSSSASNTDQYSRYSYGDISIRVPAEGLKNILSQLKSLSTQVIREEVSGQDITQQYVDLQSTLDNLENSKLQLTKIMAEAKKSEDVLNVFKELSKVQERINVTQGQIKYFKESTALSLINVHLETKPTIKENIGHWQLWEATKQSFNALVGALERFSYSAIYFVIYYVPLLILWGVIGLIAYRVGRKLYISFKK